MEATHLECLAEGLTSAGFAVTAAGRDRDELAVRNPDVPELAETVRCAPLDGATLSFVWSWGPAIAPVDDVELALERIAHVLKAVDS